MLVIRTAQDAHLKYRDDRKSLLGTVSTVLVISKPRLPSMCPPRMTLSAMSTSSARDTLAALRSTRRRISARPARHHLRRQIRSGDTRDLESHCIGPFPCVED